MVQWLRGNKLSLNEIKTELTTFRSPRKQLPREPDIRLNICKLKLHTYVKYSETTEQRTHRDFKKICPLLRGVRYLEVVHQRSWHLGLNISSAIYCISGIWDGRYWEVSLYLGIFIDEVLCRNKQRNITCSNYLELTVYFLNYFILHH